MDIKKKFKKIKIVAIFNWICIYKGDKKYITFYI